MATSIQREKKMKRVRDPLPPPPNDALVPPPPPPPPPLPPPPSSYPIIVNLFAYNFTYSYYAYNSLYILTF